MLLHSVARAVAAAVLLIGDLSARRGLWRSDAAGDAQCGSGEAALCLLPIPHSLSLFLVSNLLSSLTPPPLPPYTPFPPSSQFYLSSYIAFLPLLPLTLLFFLFLFLSSSAALLLCYVWWIYQAVCLDESHGGFRWLWMQ